MVDLNIFRLVIKSKLITEVLTYVSKILGMNTWFVYLTCNEIEISRSTTKDDIFVDKSLSSCVGQFSSRISSR